LARRYLIFPEYRATKPLQHPGRAGVAALIIAGILYIVSLGGSHPNLGVLAVFATGFISTAIAMFTLAGFNIMKDQPWWPRWQQRVSRLVTAISLAVIMSLPVVWWKTLRAEHLEFWYQFATSKFASMIAVGLFALAVAVVLFGSGARTRLVTIVLSITYVGWWWYVHQLVTAYQGVQPMAGL